MVNPFLLGSRRCHRRISPWVAVTEPTHPADSPSSLGLLRLKNTRSCLEMQSELPTLMPSWDLTQKDLGQLIEKLSSGLRSSVFAWVDQNCTVYTSHRIAGVITRHLQHSTCFGASKDWLYWIPYYCNTWTPALRSRPQPSLRPRPWDPLRPRSVVRVAAGRPTLRDPESPGAEGGRTGCQASEVGAGSVAPSRTRVTNNQCGVGSENVDVARYGAFLKAPKTSPVRVFGAEEED